MNERDAAASLVDALLLEGGDNPGVWIERQAEALGVSVARIAREAGIDRVTIYRWKRGDVEPFWGSVLRVRTVIHDFWKERERRR